VLPRACGMQHFKLLALPAKFNPDEVMARHSHNMVGLGQTAVVAGCRQGSVSAFPAPSTPQQVLLAQGGRARDRVW